MKLFTASFSPFLLLLVLAGCATPEGSYQSNRIDDPSLLSRNTTRSLAYEGPARNPVIVIHGFLGARLREQESGNEVWGTFSATVPPVKMLRDLAHPMRLGVPLRQLRDSTVADALLDTVNIRVMGFPFSMHAYANLIDLLVQSGYVQENKPLPAGRNFANLFVFYYDWRRDIPENARKLGLFIQAKRRRLQQEYKQRYNLEEFDVQFDIVAHSMGGMVARYYLRYGDADLPENPEETPKITWAGAQYIDKLIQVGTPNGGYLDTLLEMTHGLRLAPGGALYPPLLVGTFPSIYQMLPHPDFRVLRNEGGKNLDLFDPALWIKHGWGLADKSALPLMKEALPEVSSQERHRAILLDHLAKCLIRARSFIRAMAEQDPLPGPKTRQILFLGDSVATSAQAVVGPDGKPQITQLDSGDGKITAVSARFDRRDPDAAIWDPHMVSPIRWDAIIHLRGAHMGITWSPEFSHNVRFYLVQFPSR